MKKIILLCTIALLAISCTQSEPEPLSTKQVIDVAVSGNEWVESTDANGLNRYYSCHISMPEINSTIFNNGSVLVYYLDNNTQQPLPNVRHYQNTTGNYWTQTIDFDYAKGGMNIYFTASDFAAVRPNSMNFRVVLMW